VRLANRSASEIVARLRGPDGCPWDREQTHATLREGLLEEAYEVVEAINTGDDANLREELGDLLLQVVFHAQLAAEENRFTVDDVARDIADKLIRRHPHVFGDAHCADSASVLKRWDEIKRAEKGGKQTSVLGRVPRGLPALIRAAQLQKKAARVGFDWTRPADVLAKVREEITEVEGAMREEQSAASPASARLEEEIGDLLFSVVNLARKLNVDAEVALARAAEKFVSRFEQLEELAGKRALALEKMTLPEMDALWDEVKRRGAG
jgi:MazG family protein